MGGLRPPGARSRARALLTDLDRRSQKKPSTFCPTHPDNQAQIPYTRNLKPYAVTAILTGLLVFMGIVVLFGLALNGGNFAPGYEPPQIYNYEDYR